MKPALLASRLADIVGPAGVVSSLEERRTYESDGLPSYAATPGIVVLPDSAELDVKVIGSFDRVVLVLDGQESTNLQAGDEVHVRLDRGGVRVVQNPAQPFLRSLQKKLGWQGSRKRSM